MFDQQNILIYSFKKEGVFAWLVTLLIFLTPACMVLLLAGIYWEVSGLKCAYVWEWIIIPAFALWMLAFCISLLCLSWYFILWLSRKAKEASLKNVIAISILVFLFLIFVLALVPTIYEWIAGLI